MVPKIRNKATSTLVHTLSTATLVLAESLGFMTTLAAVRASTTHTAVNLALRTGLFGHGSDLVDAVDGGVLQMNRISILTRKGSRLKLLTRTVAPVPWALVAPASMALSLWGTPLSYSAPRTILKDVGEDKVDLDPIIWLERLNSKFADQLREIYLNDMKVCCELIVK
jgi:hypothetical protein